MKTALDNRLEEELFKVGNDAGFLDSVFRYCELQEERNTMLAYVLNGHKNRESILLKASMIGTGKAMVESWS